MMSKLFLRSAAILLATSILSPYASQAVFEDEMDEKNVSRWMTLYKGINKDTLPTCLKEAPTQKNQAILLGKHLRASQLIEQMGSNFQIKGHGQQKAIEGVRVFFQKNILEVQNIMKTYGFGRKYPESDLSTIMTSFSSNQMFPSVKDEERKNLFDQNKKISQEGGYTLDNNFIKIEKPSLNNMKVYGHKDDNYKPKFSAQSLDTRRIYITEMTVLDADTINHAFFLKDIGLNPLVIDMANAVSPGGAAHTGHGNVQEEQCIYRSDLGTYVFAAKERCQDLGASHNFIPKEGGIYIPGVQVFRTDANGGYAFVSKPQTLDFGAIAAYRHKDRLIDKPNSLVDEKYYPEIKDDKIYWESTRQKIRSFFDMALENGHDSLVLSAFGCGAFKNPTPEMVQAFEVVLEEYKNCFQRIDFAIYAKENPHDKNLLAFQNAFNGKVQKLSNQNNYQNYNPNNYQPTFNPLNQEVKFEEIQLNRSNWISYKDKIESILPGFSKKIEDAERSHWQALEEDYNAPSLTTDQEVKLWAKTIEGFLEIAATQINLQNKK
ncbi:TIGR02452 family protein [Candidatus Bealeia paramacronuclearis]|uniref:TIGR02452 family protein n=1 Tax=Candidatus Bealeia paramacronuclearis TaxID=1921001 RepID=A0ABZ2C5I6_9PROT|nr:hypothetical protein [Candidatus Bealeia paramacronuclearis]